MSMKITIKKHSDRELLCNAATVCSLMPTIMFFVSVLSRQVLHIGNINGIVYVLLYLYIAYVLVKANNVFSYLRTYTVPVILLILLFFAIIDKNTARIIFSQNLVIELFLGVIAYVIWCNIEDASYLFKQLRATSIILVFVGIMLLFFSRISTNYMAYGYRMLFPTIVLLCFGIVKENRCDLLIGLGGVVAIAIGGSRASLLIAVVAVPIIIMGFRKYRQTRTLRLCVVFIILCMIVYLFNQQIFSIISNILGNNGTYSRTLAKIIAGTYSSDSHRTESLIYGFDLLSKNGVWHLLFGYGLAAERFYFLRDLSYMNNYGYPHNIILELLLQYGIVGGALTISVVVHLLKRALTRGMDEHRKMISYVLVLFNLQLLVSSSYIQSILFFSLLGWCISCGRLEKRRM